MSIYYLLLVLERFHDYPHMGGELFAAGFIPVTGVKIAGLCAVLAALVLARPSDAARPLGSALPWLFALFAAWPLLGTVAFGRPLPQTSLSYLVSLALLLIASRRLVSTEGRLRKSIRTMVAAAAVSTAWCYKQYFFEGAGRVWGVGLDPNYEAMSLIMMAPLALWMARNEPTRNWRIVGGVAAASVAVATVFSESRGGLIALMVVALVELIRARRRPARGLAFVVIFGVLVALAPASLWERFANIRFSGRPANSDEESTLAREELLIAGLNMIESHPFFGVGMDLFKPYGPIYNPDLRTSQASGVAHNSYLQVGAEAGLPTLALFIAIMVLGLRNYRAVQRLHPDQAVAELSRAMRLAVLAYATAAFFLTAQYLVVYWLFIFLSQNLREIGAAQASAAGAKEPAARAPYRPSLVRPRRVGVA